MKKIFLALSLTLTLGLASFTTNPIETKPKTSVEKNKTEVDCRYGQCLATAKSTGKQCKHCVSNSGDSYCWQHKE